MKRGIIIQDEEQIQRRRGRRRRSSSTVISLPERNETELKRMNDSQKGKGKQIINESEPNQKKKARQDQLHHSSLQHQAREFYEDWNILKTHVPCPHRVPSRKILQTILDFIESDDKEKIFGGPVAIEPNTATGNYFSLLYQKMNLATLRAKLEEDFYTTLEHFKHDVCLMLAIAMNSNPEHTRTHQLAKEQSLRVKQLIDNLPNEQKEDCFEPVHHKLPPRAVGHARFRPAPQVTTDKYEPQNNQPRVPSGAHQRVQMSNDGGQHHLAEELRATAQTVEGKRSETQGLGEIHNLLTNFHGREQSSKQVLQPRQEKEAASTLQSDSVINKAFDHQQHSLNLSLAYNPPVINSIPGINNKGKEVVQNDDWNVRASNILGDYFINSNKGLGVCSDTSNPVGQTSLISAGPTLQPQPQPQPWPWPQTILRPVPATSPRWNKPESLVLHGFGRTISTPFASPPPFGYGSYSDWLMNGVQFLSPMGPIPMPSSSPPVAPPPPPQMPLRSVGQPHGAFRSVVPNDAEEKQNTNLPSQAQH